MNSEHIISPDDKNMHRLAHSAQKQMKEHKKTEQHITGENTTDSTDKGIALYNTGQKSYITENINKLQNKKLVMPLSVLFEQPKHFIKQIRTAEYRKISSQDRAVPRRA